MSKKKTFLIIKICPEEFSSVEFLFFVLFLTFQQQQHQNLYFFYFYFFLPFMQHSKNSTFMSSFLQNFSLYILSFLPEQDEYCDMMLYFYTYETVISTNKEQTSLLQYDSTHNIQLLKHVLIF